jgi:hypothetical protein
VIIPFFSLLAWQANRIALLSNAPAEFHGHARGYLQFLHFVGMEENPKIEDFYKEGPFGVYKCG